MYTRAAGRQNGRPVPRVLVISIDPAEAAYRLRLGILPPLLAPDGSRSTSEPGRGTSPTAAG